MSGTMDLMRFSINIIIIIMDLGRTTNSIPTPWPRRFVIRVVRCIYKFHMKCYTRFIKANMAFRMKYINRSRMLAGV